MSNGDAKARLAALHKHVDRVTRRLRMGEKDDIPLGEFTVDEVRTYIWALADHKDKWFEVQYDPTSRVFHVTRAEPLKPTNLDDDAEEEVP